MMCQKCGGTGKVRTQSSPCEGELTYGERECDVCNGHGNRCPRCGEGVEADWLGISPKNGEACESCLLEEEG